MIVLRDVTTVIRKVALGEGLNGEKKCSGGDWVGQ